MTQNVNSILGYTNVNDRSSALIPTGLANASNSHFTDPVPQFSSIVGAVSGCGGSPNSAAALAQRGVYNMQQIGGSWRKGGSRKMRGCYGGRRKSRKGGKRSRRSMKKQRGGGYHQYLGNVPLSANFSTGGVKLTPQMSGLASPPPITPFNNCAKGNLFGLKPLIQGVKGM